MTAITRFQSHFRAWQGIINTGSGSVIWGGGEPVAKIAFDDIVDRATNRGERRVRLLKLDCEGAEWPILLTSQRLHLIGEICGEFHEIGGALPGDQRGPPGGRARLLAGRPTKFTIDVLVGCLERAGFTVTYRRHMRPTGALEGLGLFFATRAPAGLNDPPNSSE